MKRFLVFTPVIGWLLLSFNPAKSFSQEVAGVASANAHITYIHDVLPIILGKCYSCHNDQTRFLPDWSDYRTAFSHRLEIKRRVWDSWKGEYYKQPMPAGNSPQCLTMTEAERRIIKDWVEQGAVYGIPSSPKNTGSKTESIETGRQIFATTCVPCHQADGRGIPERFPPLAASDFLNTDKKRAIQTLLTGRQGEIIVNGRTFNNTMPRFPFSDEQIANVLTYVYNSYGNSGLEVIPGEVKILRGQAADPPQEKHPANAKPGPWE